MSGVERMVHQMVADGLRVIAVACRQLTHRQVQSACEDPDAFAELCGDRLRIAGLLGLWPTVLDRRRPTCSLRWLRTTLASG